VQSAEKAPDLPPPVGAQSLDQELEGAPGHSRGESGVDELAVQSAEKAPDLPPPVGAQSLDQKLESAVEHSRGESGLDELAVRSTARCSEASFATRPALESTLSAISAKKQELEVADPQELTVETGTPAAPKVRARRTQSCAMTPRTNSGKGSGRRLTRKGIASSREFKARYFAVELAQQVLMPLAMLLLWFYGAVQGSAMEDDGRAEARGRAAEAQALLAHSGLVLTGIIIIVGLPPQVSAQECTFPFGLFLLSTIIDSTIVACAPSRLGVARVASAGDAPTMVPSRRRGLRPGRGWLGGLVKTMRTCRFLRHSAAGVPSSLRSAKLLQRKFRKLRQRSRRGDSSGSSHSEPEQEPESVTMERRLRALSDLKVAMQLQLTSLEGSIVLLHDEAFTAAAASGRSAAASRRDKRYSLSTASTAPGEKGVVPALVSGWHYQRPYDAVLKGQPLAEPSPDTPLDAAVAPPDTLIEPSAVRFLSLDIASSILVVSEGRARWRTFGFITVFLATVQSCLPLLSRLLSSSTANKLSFPWTTNSSSERTRAAVLLALLCCTTFFYSLQIYKRLHLGLLGFTRRQTISKHLLAFFDVANKYGLPALDRSSFLHGANNLAIWSQVRKLVLQVSEIVDGRHVSAIEILLAVDLAAVFTFCLMAIVHKAEVSMFWQLLFFLSLVTTLYLFAALHRGSKANVTQREHVSSLIEWRCDLRLSEWEKTDALLQMELTGHDMNDFQSKLLRREVMGVQRTIELIGDLVDVLQNADHCGVCRIFSSELDSGVLMKLVFLMCGAAITISLELVDLQERV